METLYQWRFNGTNLVAATNSAFSFNNAQKTNEGSYSVAVSNSVGFEISSNALLTVTLPTPLQLVPITPLTNRQFHMFVLGPAGSNCVIRASTDLVHWSQLAVLTLTTGKVEFVDVDSPNFAKRFYSALLGSNAPPTVSISSPSDGATLSIPANIQICASASDSDGSVAQVEFYAGTNLLGTVTNSPYCLSWSNTVVGNYSLTARAIDNLGLIATSSVVNVTITTNAAPPALQLIPLTTTNGQFRMQITGPAGSNCLIRVSTDLIHWSPLAVVMLTNGLITFVDSTSPGVPMRFYSAVLLASLPTASIGSPGNGATFVGPTNIAICANAASAAGTISRVEFYIGPNLLGTVTNQPYCITWSNVAAGNYALTVRAFDNLGVAATSGIAQVTITSNSAPPGLRLIPVTPITNGQFRLQIIGPVGSTCLIRVSTNLINWLPLAMVRLTNGLASFVDTTSPSFPYRFYSAVLVAGVPVIQHQSPTTYSGGSTFVVTNTFEYADSLISLLWRPKLLGGWHLVSASGDGNPEVNAGEILWTGALPPTPIRMTYTVQVPPGESGTKQIRGEVEYQFFGTANPVTDYASPDPLVLNSTLVEPSITHTSAAGYTPGTLIFVTNSFSYSNTLQSLLWRPRLATSWTLVAASGDGNPDVVSGEVVWASTIPPSPIQMRYTVQTPLGDTGPKQIRGEVEYQFAGMVNPTVGFAGPDPLTLNGPVTGLSFTHQSSTNYISGGVLSVTNTITFTNTLASLLWRPHLPTGWALLSVAGDGSPEMNFGDIIWTGALPSSPIQMRYTVQIPAGQTGSRQIRGEVEYQFQGMPNPANTYASPDPIPVN